MDSIQRLRGHHTVRNLARLELLTIETGVGDERKESGHSFFTPFLNDLLSSALRLIFFYPFSLE